MIDRPPDAAEEAVDSLAPGQVAALARALGILAEDLHGLREKVRIHLDSEQGAIDARANAWNAIAGFVASYPGRAVLTLLGIVLVAAVARALGVDPEYLRAIAGAAGAVTGG